MWLFKTVERLRDWIQRRWEAAPGWQRALGVAPLVAFIVCALVVLVISAPFVADQS